MERITVLAGMDILLSLPSVFYLYNIKQAYTNDGEFIHSAGYKSAFPDNSAYNSYRLPFIGQEYRVFVRPGVVCNTLCNDWQLGPAGCKEIPVRNECLKK